MAFEPDVEKTAASDAPSRHDLPTSSDEHAHLSPDQADEESPPPDGGLVAWSQVMAGLLVNMLAWGYPSTFGVYQLHYRDTLDLPDAQISWIGSLQTFLAFAICTFSGRLADAGYVRSTTAAGLGLAVFGTFMTSVAMQYWHIFLAQGICTGLGLGIMFMPCMAVVSSYFEKKRSFALAVAAMGTGIGSVVFPAMVQYLIPRVGFAWAVRCGGFVALFIAVAAMLLLKPRLKPRRSGPLVEWTAFKEVPYVLYTLGAFLFFWALYFGFFYINAYARNVVGFSTVDSVQLLLITNGLSVPSRPLVGFVSDRYCGPINMYILSTFVLGAITFAWIGVTTRAGMYAFAVFFGLANGAAQGVFVGSLASLTPNPRKMGTRFGMVCTIVGFATLAGPPTAGAIIDQSEGRYLWAQIWAGLVICLGSLTLAAARCLVTGMEFKVKI
ncbi:major facilitator superfamily domain-containing protein [Apodospora peruviana]|uniref:Major facilitator superfamily domain-containing protein n=1 Tax=Apodospora peruviana TaxID=516989 RepID=A0AAE0MAR2_9PEZI|nr:major facilitator superfamily domain-containing protein [Apodospora peruviana]